MLNEHSISTRPVSSTYGKEISKPWTILKNSQSQVKKILFVHTLLVDSIFGTSPNVRTSKLNFKICKDCE
jgi:hypothetical protein